MVEPSVEAAGIEPAQDSFGWVYIIRAGNGGRNTLFKVGWAKDPRKRLKDLQVGSSIELELMGAVRGGRSRERGLHEEWKWYRSHGEWFRQPPGMLDLLVDEGEMVHPFIERVRTERLYWADRRETAA